MQDAIVWGSLIIKYNYIAIAFSVLAAYMAMKYWLKGKSDISKPILEDISNVFFWAFIIWKFSVIIFNPVSVINNPLYILYFSGGKRGILLAAIAVLIFLIIQSRKRKITIWMYAAVLSVGLLSYKLMYSLFELFFNYPQSFMYILSQIVLAIVLLIWLYNRKESFGNPHEIFQLILWFSIGQIFSYFLQSFHTAVFLGLSSIQLIFLAIALGCLFIPNFIKKKNFNES
jgi:hypothetical protein